MARRIRPRHHAVVALKSGVLSGKYTRANAGQHQADRGAMVGAFLNEKPTRSSTNSKPSPVRTTRTWPAWRLPGCARSRCVSSVIIGARRLSQLDDNVRAVDVHLGADGWPGWAPSPSRGSGSRRT